MTVNKEWQKIKVNKIAPQEFKRLSEKENYYILDVTPKDTKLNASFIKGAVHCPLVYLADRYREIPKNRMLMITDWAMKQSPVAAKFLTIKGYSIVGVLKGGSERWNSEHFPVELRAPSQEIAPLYVPNKKK